MMPTGVGKGTHSGLGGEELLLNLGEGHAGRTGSRKGLAGGRQGQRQARGPLIQAWPCFRERRGPTKCFQQLCADSQGQETEGEGQARI